jgi:hypothetical protein
MKLDTIEMLDDQDDYLIVVANKSKGYTITKLKDVKGNIVTLPNPIPYNCDSECEDCKENGKYGKLMVTNCDSPSVKIQIYCKYENSSKPSGWADLEIRPNCDYSGEFVCVDIQ